ncbi:hypothetical protein C8R45DRAFT_931870 [Mycena sanguinolenta]|nr:hypothetical protein C8R45DRAFT_931870 [Mycena sanguinolenta]
MLGAFEIGFANRTKEEKINSDQHRCRIDIIPLSATEGRNCRHGLDLNGLPRHSQARPLGSCIVEAVMARKAHQYKSSKSVHPGPVFVMLLCEEWGHDNQHRERGSDDFTDTDCYGYGSCGVPSEQRREVAGEVHYMDVHFVIWDAMLFYKAMEHYIVHISILGDAMTGPQTPEQALNSARVDLEALHDAQFPGLASLDSRETRLEEREGEERRGAHRLKDGPLQGWPLAF